MKNLRFSRPEILQRGRENMHKLKSHRGAAKRFKFTKSGLVKFRHAYRAKHLSRKLQKRKRQLRKDGCLNVTDAMKVKKMLPYV
jgi:large subunit ribosomal protein L35